MKQPICLLMLFLLLNNSLTIQQRPPPPPPPLTIVTTTTAKLTTTTTTSTTTTSSSLPNIITGWKKSSDVGYKNYTADVYSVKYDSSYVYVSSNSIPSYSIGPWASNPNTPTPQNSTYKFYRNPSYGNTKTSMRLGAIGIKDF